MSYRETFENRGHGFPIEGPQPGRLADVPDNPDVSMNNQAASDDTQSWVHDLDAMAIDASHWYI